MLEIDSEQLLQTLEPVAECGDMDSKAISTHLIAATVAYELRERVQQIAAVSRIVVFDRPQRVLDEVVGGWLVDGREQNGEGSEIGLRKLSRFGEHAGEGQDAPALEPGLAVIG
jgi:hypothetical protein